MSFLTASVPHVPFAVSGDTRDETILLVEDDADIRLILLEFLENNGYDVVQAADAEDAAELLGRGLQPSLVITDINLGPGRTGMMLADDVHALQPWIPIVFITGRLDMLRERGLRTHEFVVPKPFPLSALLGVVRHFVRPAPAPQRCFATV